MTVANRSVSIALAWLVLGLGGASARATGWSHPVTVAREGELSTTGAALVESPNGRRIYLVAAREHNGYDLYAWLSGGSFGAATRVPSAPLYREGTEGDRRGQFPSPSAAVNDAGAVVVGWSEVPRGVEPNLGVEGCFCAIRAVVRDPVGQFAPVSTVAPPSSPDKRLLGIGITPRGRASVLWEENEDRRPRRASLRELA
jgi:hypothetical protein